MRRAGDEGTQVHNAIEDYLKGEEDLFSEISSNSDINIGLFNVPQGVTMPKWNPVLLLETTGSIWKNL
jgi:hypothetical protein